MLARRGIAPSDVKQTVHQAQVSVGGDHIDMVRLHMHPLANLIYRHRGGPGEQWSQVAFVGGVKVLHQHERQAGVGGQGAEKLGDGFQPSCRDADAHDGRDLGEAAAGELS